MLTSHKKLSILLILVAIVVLLIFAVEIFAPKDVRSKNLDAKIITANTETLREQGLSGRESLDKDSVMLFVFDKPDRYGFWMKDMKFPIDIIWLDENRYVVGVTKNLSPSSFPQIFFPPEKILYAIETNVGFFEEKGLVVGDKIVL